jgi:hypothetical protein
MNTFSRSVRRLYQALPVITQLRAIQDQLAGLQQHLRLVESANVIQVLETLKASNERYRDRKRLLAHGAQYWSQNYEDGMIAEIFRRIGTASKTFLEIGVGNGSENNTTALLSAGWSGYWIEADVLSYSSICSRLKTMPQVASRLKVRQAFVSAENIQGLLAELAVPSEIDLLSLDIDLNTYHVWVALEQLRPRVVVVEYNAGFPPDQVWIHPYEPDQVWDGTQDFGASLKAYELVGRRFGYNLVGCDLIGANAFFVRSNLIGDKFASPFTAENHYEPPRYHLWHRFGHPAKFFGETHAAD